MMGRSLCRATMPTMLVLLLVISYMAPIFEVTDLEQNSTNYTSLNTETTVSVSSYPNGTSDTLKLEVPVNHAVTNLDLSISPHILPRSESISWDSVSDWNMSGVITDGVDFNGTEGMKVQPREISWDFEYPNSAAFAASGWTLGTGWYWGYDSSLGQNGGVHAGTKAIYTYNGNYPNNVPSSGYFATSPVVDCSSCSGSWQLKYWKRLGIESYYYDQAQVHIKNQQGNWVTVWNWAGYSVNPSTWTQMSHDISSHVNGNSNLQVRFKLGRTDGSVTYTGWNVDDVEFKPAGGGLGTGSNWTSPAFGPSAVGPLQSQKGAYGLMSIDATVPPGSSLTWSVLDGYSKQPIAGYVDINSFSADLGAIDSEKHPTLRIRLYMNQPTGASSPIIHGLYAQGRYVSSFQSDPGWTGTIGWDGDSFPGTGYIESDVFESRRPISRVRTDITTSGTGAWQMKVNDETWGYAPQGSWQTMPTYVHKVQFRWSSNVASSDFRSVDIKIDTGGMPESPRIDTGLDGLVEWGIESQSIGQWGWQDRLSTGGYSKDFTWTTSGTKQIGVWLPKDGLEALSYTLTPSTAGIQNLNTSLTISGTEIMNRQMGTTGSVNLVVLSQTEISELNSNLSNATAIWPPPGKQVGVEYIQGVFSVSADYGGIQLGGLAAVHHPIANLSYSATDEMIWSINDIIPASGTSGSTKLVPLTVQMANSGSLKATITDFSSTSEISTDSLEIINGTTTLAPSQQWLEVNSTHTAPIGTVAAVQLDLMGTLHQVRTLCQNDGSLAAVPGSTDLEMVQWKQGDGCQISINGTSVTTSMRFRLNASWDDDPSMILKVRLVLIDGRTSVPKLQPFGVGSQFAIENDVEVKAWEMYNDLGVPIPVNRLFLKSNAPITVKVDLGFPSLDSWFAPRANDVMVRVFENDVVVANSTAIINGSVSIPLMTPMSSQPVEYRIDTFTLFGQENISYISLNRTYQIDSLAPMVINQNIRKYDHLQQSLTQEIKVEVYDRPILPDYLSLMLWRDWIDDTNYDGSPNATEYIEYQMQTPSNTSQAQGNYTFLFDDTDGPNGGIVAGYVVGSDAAGNLITRGGGSGIDEQLFTYQLAQDGEPLIIGQGGFVDGEHSWLHPATQYEIAIPFDEPNGLSDLDFVRLQLASNSIVDSLEVLWDASTNRCNGTGSYLIVNSCHIHAREGEISPFTSELEIRLEFTLDWGLPLENDLRRAPALTVQDRSGSESWLELPQLRWRFSPDLAITSESILLEAENGAVIGQSAWVQPGTGLNISGQVTFVETDLAPSLPFNVSILLDGQRYVVSTTSGYFLAQLSAPSESKSHALSFELAGLPPEAVDATDPSGTLFWIEVDDNAPTPVLIDSPREGTEIAITDLSAVTIELRLSEQEKLNVDTLNLYFKVALASQPNGAALIEGSTPLTVTGSPVGQSILVFSSIDVASRLPDDAFNDALILSVWVKGSDMAGNGMESSSQFNSGSTPFASWDIEHLVADIELTKISYSRSGELEIGQTTMVSIELRNAGHASGTAKLLAYEMGRDGENRSLTPVSISIAVPMGERVTYDIDWIPEDKGERWVVLVLDDGSSMEGEHINIKQKNSDDTLSGVFSDVPMTWMLVIAVLLLILTLTVALALRTGGDGESSLDDTDDWGDGSEWEDDDQQQSTYASPAEAMAAAQFVSHAGDATADPTAYTAAPIQPTGGYQQQEAYPYGDQTQQQTQQWTQEQWLAYQQQYQQYYNQDGQPPPPQ